MSKVHFPKFDKYAIEGETVSLSIDGFDLVATIYRDDDATSPDKRDDGFWPSLDPNSCGYIGDKSKSTLSRHMRKAKDVLQAWKDDEWFYCGVAVVVSKCGIELTGEFDHALWGIECNYPFSKNGNAYISECADSYIGEAMEAAKAKLLELAA